MRQFLKKHWLIIAFTLVGAFLRLYRLQASLQFLGDQGRDAIVLRNILVNHDLPFIGPITSVGGFFLGPLYYYLMFPFLWLANYNPAGPAYATAVIGIITIPVLFFITKKMLSQKAAIFTTLLYSLAAVPALQTRGAWNPNPMPLAALGLIFGFYQAQTTKKPKWLILSALSLGAALQLHYMIVFLAPFILYQLYLVFKQPKLRRGLIPWFLTVILMMLPLILFELKNNFINSKGLMYYLTQNNYQQIDLWEKFRHLKGRSEQAIGMLLGFGEPYSLLREWLTRLIWIPAAYLFFKQSKLGPKTIILWLFFTIPTITFYQGRIPPYYLGFIFPCVFMLVGYLLSLLKGKLNLITAAFIAVFLYFNLPTLYHTLNETGNLRSVKTTARFIFDDVKDHQYQNYNLTLLDDTKDYKAYAFRYFLEVFGGRPLGIDQYPQADVLYVISPYIQTVDILTMGTWELKSLQPAGITQTWEFPASENVYKIERLQ